MWSGSVNSLVSTPANWACCKSRQIKRQLSGRKLFVALWKLTSAGVVIEGAAMKASA